MTTPDDPYADLEEANPAQRGWGARLGWLWGALAATALTVSVMYFVMRPDAETAAPTPAPTTTATVTITPTPEPQPTVTTTVTVTPKPEIAPTPTSKPPAATWISLGEDLVSPEDAWNLDSLPEGFAEYAAGLLAGEDGCTPEIYVSEVHASGFVIGAEGDGECGGGAWIVWSDTSGTWKDVLGFQDLLPCSDYENAGVLRGTNALECADGDDIRIF